MRRIREAVMATPVWGESFATLLTHLRKDAGMTQERLADRSGLSVRAISSLECGERRPRRYTLERLAQALRLSPEQRAVFVATAARDRRRPPDGPSLPTVNASAGPLVGRAPELGQLRAHIAGSGPPMLAYTGEPGIGRSRLLAEAVAICSDWGTPVLAAGARRGDDGYAPLVQALADHVRYTPAATLAAQLRDCDGLDLLLPELAGRVRRLPVTSAAQARRLAAAAAVRFVDAIAGDGRLVLVLDDVQWAGPDAADLLSHLVRRSRSRVRVVVAYRAAEVVPGSPIAQCAQDLGRLGLVRTRRLHPLAPHEADALVRGTVDSLGAGTVPGPANLDPATRARIVRRAAGVPLYLVELTRSAVEDGGEEVPWHLRLAVGQELAALPRPVFALLRRMALTATTVAVERLVADDLESDQLLEYLEVALRFGILDQTRRGFRFRYPLVREVLSSGLGPARRRLRRGADNADEAE
jgi:transcriptional regulator with XRE-family HTH domain